MSSADAATAATVPSKPTSTVLSTRMLNVGANDNANTNSVTSASVTATADASANAPSSSLQLPSPFVLAPNDWILPAASRVALLFFWSLPTGWSGQGRTNDDFMSAHRMADSLERLITVHYPILGGRFRRNESQGTVEIDSMESGVPFVTAETPVDIKDLPLGQPGDTHTYTSTRCLPPSLKLIADMDWSNPLDGPIFAVQHTRFACGGVCVGVHMHHLLGDAASFFGLMNDWTSLYRSGGIHLNQPPSLDRSVFVPTTEEMKLRLATGGPDGGPHNEFVHMVPSTKPAWTMPKPTIMKSFRLESRELDNIKKAATATTKNAAEGGSTWVSTFEALTAHLHRMVYIARHPAEITHNPSAAAGTNSASEASSSSSTTSSEVVAAATAATPTAPGPLHLAMATNWRGRLVNPTPHPRYFGNAALYSMLILPEPHEFIFGTSGSTTDATSDESILVRNARMVHDALARFDDRQLRGSMSWIAAQDRKDAIVPNFQLAGRDFAITAWHKFGNYSCACFEVNVPPIKVSLPFMTGIGMDGVAILMACPPDAKATAVDAVVVSSAASSASSSTSSASGSESAIELLLGLEEEAMERLEANPEFRQYRS